MNTAFKIFYFLLWFFFLFLISACSREEVRQYAPTENYPNDSILSSLENKRALIVIAHDDDMCAMSGTISFLNKQGWEIGVVSLSKSPERNKAQREACRSILDTVIFVDLELNQIRNDLDRRRGYLAFPKDSFELVFDRPSIEFEYLKHIKRFDPEVIFTLDNEFGGYGHPEHVLISQIVVDLAMENRISPSYIYQSVFTDHMENTIMERHSRRMIEWGFPGDHWQKAKNIYGVNGMPEPSVQIPIREEAREKMNYLRSYNENERNKIGYFIPAFEAYSAEEYFGIFDREFFRIIEVNSNPSDS